MVIKYYVHVEALPGGDYRILSYHTTPGKIPFPSLEVTADTWRTGKSEGANRATKAGRLYRAD